MLHVYPSELYSGADPGIFGRGASNFDSENTTAGRHKWHVVLQEHWNTEHGTPAGTSRNTPKHPEKPEQYLHPV